jgi:hypothetical protein
MVAFYDFALFEFFYTLQRWGWRETDFFERSRLVILLFSWRIFRIFRSILSNFSDIARVSGEKFYFGLEKLVKGMPKKNIVQVKAK